ncbi:MULTISPECIES: PIG-L family deacetylase [unclassified Pseudovibrio]|uniref:PIG-L family deacetylase n=1 Tax=unclassified Pseudovibrio TaxID=2627060 RepID=UPI0007AE3DA7|nr:MULTISPECIES: PIG-L family deacetylase [unclassified Pseudovibrio]KZL00528.1 Mycothiol S-conjugate amidase [Pseudovibrio sp. W74]KZL07703.1 Mycothiol S-conjugate amidase [Pseudovibrio sp. Ad14]
MPLSEQERIAEHKQSVRMVSLWRALQPLKSTVSFMNTGAHPDDEISEMLAAIGLRDGIALSYACANRGEGGQNDIGTEATENLGVLRTAEMEKACDVLNMRMYWLSENAEDSVFDFGFSKSGVETLGKWGHQRTLKRFVEIIRQERPDIISPTFLNIPGQHGHHCAMTQAAFEVMKAAADPEFPDVDLPCWAVKKLYLPAWSGAGGAYDDEVPPPPATLEFDGNGEEEVTGWSWAQIGEQSRAFHKTQGMGRWQAYDKSNVWPLHLAESTVGTDELSLSDNLPKDLSELAAFAGAPTLSALLDKAHDHCLDAIEAFPNRVMIGAAAAQALKLLRKAMDECPEAARDEVLHRLERKELQLAKVLELAEGIVASVRLSQDQLKRGESAEVAFECNREAVSFELDLPKGWVQQDACVQVGGEADTSDPYPAVYRPDAVQAPCAKLQFTSHGVAVETRLPFEVEPIVLPFHVVTLDDTGFVLNNTLENRSLSIPVGGNAEGLSLDVPEGWTAQFDDGVFQIALPDDVANGLYELPILQGGEQAYTVHVVSYPHVSQRVRVTPATVRICVVEAHLDAKRVGYVGSGNDRVAKWLGDIGVELVDLPVGELSAKRLQGLDCLVVGIFAFRSRQDLHDVIEDIHAWVKAGGRLITLYHRPWDRWDAEKLPLQPLEIGSPSLRWRVTDENAEVRYLNPQHVLLNKPNEIGKSDWANWHKERGLYFAKSWDAAYEPLLEMADPDEAPHQGILLAGDFGQGQHIHTSLILHHQMEKLVPGAFRLMANLVSSEVEEASASQSTEAFEAS